MPTGTITNVGQFVEPANLYLKLVLSIRILYTNQELLLVFGHPLEEEHRENYM